jgi:hypothetical protein
VCPHAEKYFDNPPAVDHRQERGDPPLLAGDVVAAIAARLGADRAAKLLERISGKDCGCAKRQAWLNRWHEKLRRRFQRSGGQESGADAKRDADHNSDHHHHSAGH